MGVGWTDNIYNNSSAVWYFQSVDDRNSGALSGGGSHFTLDDRKYHALKPGTGYKADWCGIPWYFEGKNFKVISQDQRRGVLFYTSEIGASNWIIYEELNTGRQVARQAVPKGSDFHCNLRFEPAGVFVDVVNNHAFSGENALYQVLSETKDWMKALAPVMAEAIKSSTAKAKSPG
jgi:hypothetical protein